jgi:hypothetical protein
LSYDYLSAYLKLVEIAIISLLGYMKNQHTFSTLAFMKDKTSQLVGATLEHNCLHVYIKVFHSKKLRKLSRSQITS